MDVSYLAASNGVGEAVRASVTSARVIGSTALSVDATTNWPQKFIGTSGTVQSDGKLDPSTVTVFLGHLNSGNIIIDQYAPGYSDKGHSVGQIVVVKPATRWANIIASVLATGWMADLGTAWTFASYDSTVKTGVVNVTSDTAAAASPGMRVKFTNNGTTQYGIITATSTTTLTIYFGTDYSLTNAAITNPSLSFMKAPQGFPLDPAKWTVEVSLGVRATKNSPTANTWYGGTSLSSAGPSITVPIGTWKLGYEAFIGGHLTFTALDIFGTLSTSASSESDPQFTYWVNSQGSNVTRGASGPMKREKAVTVAAPTKYYMNVMTSNGSVTEINIYGDKATTILRATCAYL